MKRFGLALLVGGAVTGGIVLADSAPPGSCHSEGGLPDRGCTPGLVGSKLQVCHQSTRTVRPPVSYTSRLKRKLLRQYDYADKNPRHYELDHLVPLALGGAPRDPRNLWPEPLQGAQGAHVKDAIELAEFRAVCHRGADLSAAQAIFLGDYWQAKVPDISGER